MVEPLSLDVGSTAKMSRCVSVEVQIVSIGCIGVNEEGMAIPIREKRLPPGDVCHSLGIETNVVVEPLGLGAEVDQAAFEQTPLSERPCCKAQ